MKFSKTLELVLIFPEKTIYIFQEATIETYFDVCEQISIFCFSRQFTGGFLSN